MVKNLGPTGLGLVGAIFICLSIVLGATAAENPTNLPDLQKGLEESHRQISGLQPYRPYLVPQSSPYQEKIDLKGTHSGEQVSDLKAMNCVKKRDIVCDEVQNGDPLAQGLANSLDVSVTGQPQTKRDWPGKDWEEDNIEKIVDDALNNGMKKDAIDGQKTESNSVSQHLGNNMNIDVSGITVSAINTVEGGSAVATSNIIIKPVQMIIYPSEVEEKLK